MSIIKKKYTEKENEDLELEVSRLRVELDRRQSKFLEDTNNITRSYNDRIAKLQTDNEVLRRERDEASSKVVQFNTILDERNKLQVFAREVETKLVEAEKEKTRLGDRLATVEILAADYQKDKKSAENTLKSLETIHVGEVQRLKQEIAAKEAEVRNKKQKKKKKINGF